MASRRLVCVALCVAGWLRGSATTSAAAAASVAVPPRWIFPEPGASLLLLCDALDVSVESTGGTWCVTVVRDGAAGGGTRACVAAGASVRVGGVDVGAYTAVACVGDACATTSFEVALRGHPQARVAAMLEDAGLVAAAAVVRRAPDFALAPAAAVHPPLAVRFITPLPGSSLPLSSTLHVHMGTSNETERAPLRFCVSRVLLDGAFVSALPLVLPPPQGCIDAGIYDGYLTGFGPGVHGIAVLTVLQDLTAATWTAVTVFSVGIDRPSALQSARPLALGNAVDAGGVEASAGGEAFGPPGAAAVTEGWLRALAGGYAPEMAPPRARFAPPVCARAFLVIIVGVHEMTPWDVWTVGEALHAALRALECVSVLATAPRGVLLDMASVSEELRGRQVVLVGRLAEVATVAFELRASAVIVVHERVALSDVSWLSASPAVWSMTGANVGLLQAALGDRVTHVRIGGVPLWGLSKLIGRKLLPIDQRDASVLVIGACAGPVVAGAALRRVKGSLQALGRVP